VYVRGRGTRLTDVEGREYLDCLAGLTLGGGLGWIARNTGQPATTCSPPAW